MKQLMVLALCALLSQTALAGEPTQVLGDPHWARFGAGTGPSEADGIVQIGIMKNSGYCQLSRQAFMLEK